MSALGNSGRRRSLNATQLFDYFVSDREQARRNIQCQRLGGRQVEYELELCGLNHRHIGRLFTFKNPSRVDAGLPISVSEVRAVTHQTTRRHE